MQASKRVHRQRDARSSTSEGCWRFGVRLRRARRARRRLRRGRRRWMSWCAELWAAGGGARSAAGDGRCAGGDWWVWAAGAVSLLGCGSAVSAGWEAGGEGCEGRDPAGEPGDVGLRDAGVSGDAEAGGVREVRCGERGVYVVAAGPPAGDGRCGGLTASWPSR